VHGRGVRPLRAGERRGCRRPACRACPRHGVAALEGLAGARVIWDDTRGINECEVTALRLAEERSQLRWKGAVA
jgi:hypothetical protein